MVKKKIGNRYYEKVGGIIYKYAFDSENNVYNECGQYNVSDFASLSDNELDENTRIEKSNIISQLAIGG